MRFSDSVNKRESLYYFMMKKKETESVTKKHNESARQQQSLSVHHSEHSWGSGGSLSNSLGYLLEIHDGFVFPVVRRSGLLTWIGF